MRIVVGAECSPVRAGVEARSPELRLCAHGETREAALASLKRAVYAYAHGLELATDEQHPDLLQDAFSGVAFSLDGAGIEVEVEEV